jgi:hypothetical protein
VRILFKSAVSKPFRHLNPAGKVNAVVNYIIFILQYSNAAIRAEFIRGKFWERF